MFLLDNSNLPGVAIPESPAPLCTLFKPSPNLGPFLKLDVLANLDTSNFGWNVETFDLGSPSFSGSYSQILLPVTPDSITITNYQQVDNAQVATIGSFWVDDSGNLSLYQGTSVSEATITYTDTAPFSSNFTYTLTTPANFTVTEVVSLGLTFTGGTSIGNFSQSGTTLTIYGSGTYSLPEGQDISITGTLDLTIPASGIAIASFLLPNLQFVDAVDWVGISFGQMQDAQDPQIYEFSWNESNNLLNLFLASDLMPSFPKNTSTGRSVIGSDTYQRSVS